jgi:hypothetical protein
MAQIRRTHTLITRNRIESVFLYIGIHNTAKPGKHRRSARERIHNDTLYDYLVRRNTIDIALYEWAKKRSLVKCKVSSAISD